MLRVIRTTIAIQLIAANIIFSQSGTPVNSFGVNGESFAKFNWTKHVDDYGGQVQITKDNKIIVFGCNTDSADAYYSIIRLNNDGSLDNTFNDGGKLLIKANTTLENTAGAIFLLDSVDNFILAGKLDSNNYSIVKYTETGIPDSSFGLNGKICLNGYGGNINMKQDNLNRIVLAGYIPCDSVIMIKRFLGNGNIDSTLCKDGELAILKDYIKWFPERGWNSDNFCIDNKNRILIGRYSSFYDRSYSINSFFIYRYNCDGEIDSTFGDNGTLFKDITPWGCHYPGGLSSLITDKNNNVIYNYSYGCDYYSHEVATRLKEDGTDDIGLTAYSGWISNIEFDSSGRIFFIGCRTGWPSYGMFHNILQCINEDGSRDTTFGINGELDLGYYNCPGPRDNFSYRDIKIDKNGKIILAGTNLRNNDLDFLIARLSMDGSFDNTFNREGYTVINGNDLYEIPLTVSYNTCYILRDSKNRIIVGGRLEGYGDGFPLNEFVIFRFKENGAIDSTFNINGALYLPMEFCTISIDTSDNSIYIGSSEDIVNKNAKVIKLLENGQYDKSFGVEGLVGFPSTQYNSQIRGIVIDENKKVIVSNYNSSYDIISLNSNGLVDTTFNKSGYLKFNNISFYDLVLRQTDNKIILISKGSAYNDYTFQLNYINKDGSADTSIYILDSLDGPKLYLDKDERFIVTGSIKINGINRKFISRFDFNGSIDSTFGNNGIITNNPFKSEYFNHFIVKDNPDRFFLLNSNNNIVCMSSNGFRFLDTTFAKNGFVQIENTQCKTLIADSNFIWVAGNDISILGFKVVKLYARNNQTIVFSLPDTLERNSPPIKLNAQTSSGLPVSYFINDTEIADIVNDTLIVKGSGDATITAIQPGNSSFYAAELVSRDFYVNSVMPDVITSYSIGKLRVYPNPVSSTLFIEANNEIEKVTLTNVEGKKIMELIKVGKNNIEIDFTGYDAGFYNLYLQTDIKNAPFIKGIIKL